MKTAAQTIELQKILATKFTDHQATKILDYVESRQDDLATNKDLKAVKTELQKDIKAVKSELLKDINWLKWVVSIGFTALLSIMIYLHSLTDKRIGKIEIKLEQIIQKQNKQSGD